MQDVWLENNDGNTKHEIRGVPKLVLQDLASLDRYTRLRALDYWDAEGVKFSLDPVVEAMEDENKAVRARATEIIEQQWAMEQQIIDLTFSTPTLAATRRPL